MVDTTEIEKKSLEAHVELCAERYKHLEQKLETLDEKIGSVVDVVGQTRVVIEAMSQKRHDQLIGWGLGIIGVLTGAVGWLLAHYVIK
jgi:hypothetical protein